MKTVADFTNSDFNTAWEYKVDEFFAYMGAHIEAERARQKRMENAKKSRG